MRILLLGANGFIGSRLVAMLLADGHEVRAAVRNPHRLKGRFPPIDARHVDLNRFTTMQDWRSLLAGIDAVVNCAGALQSGRGQNLKAIHEEAPSALFQACVEARVRRVVHISAISADPAATTEYALTKHSAEQRLRELDLDWVILRPSLVYAEGSHGGTSLLRALAAVPWITPLPGSGGQPFQPLHLDDLAETVALLIREPRLSRLTLEPAGPERLTLAEIVVRLRAWLGLPPREGRARANDFGASGGADRRLARQRTAEHHLHPADHVWECRGSGALHDGNRHSAEANGGCPDRSTGDGAGFVARTAVSPSPIPTSRSRTLLDLDRSERAVPRQ